MVLNPRHYNRLSGAHLVQGCRRLTSGFAVRLSSEMRVSRVDSSGPAQRALCRGMQSARAAMGPVSCGFVPDGGRTAPSETLLRVHAQGMRMH